MNRAHGVGHVGVPGVPGVFGAGPVGGHGAVGVGATPLGSVTGGTSFTAGNPIIYNPFQQPYPTMYQQPFLPNNYQQQSYQGYHHPNTPVSPDFPPIPTLGHGNYYPYY